MTAREVSSNSAYGQDYADIYDQSFDHRDDLAKVVAAISSVAPGGSILEFGIGSGRIALPLSRAGRQVVGIDNSTEMLALLAKKPGAEKIVTLVGDCTTARAAGEYSLVIICFSTLYLLGSQSAQLQCFRNAASHLPVGGRFLVEAFLHDRSQWPTNEQFSTTGVERDVVTARAAVHDPVAQTIALQHLTIRPGGISFRPNLLRYVWPSELDLMAQLAGMRFVERWGDWNKTPFGSASSNMISVYEKIQQ
jgi:SAM-dependent methyltransferase